MLINYKKIIGKKLFLIKLLSDDFKILIYKKFLSFLLRHQFLSFNAYFKIIIIIVIRYKKISTSVIFNKFQS